MEVILSVNPRTVEEAVRLVQFARGIKIGNPWSGDPESETGLVRVAYNGVSLSQQILVTVRYRVSWDEGEPLNPRLSWEGLDSGSVGCDYAFDTATSETLQDVKDRIDERLRLLGWFLR